MAVFKLGESNAPITPVANTLDESIRAWCDKVNAIVSYRLLYGCSVEIKGTIYRFSLDRDDQLDLVMDTADANLSLYLSNLPEATRRSQYPIGNYPTALSDTWSTTWQGICFDGTKTLITMNLTTYLSFAMQVNAFLKKELANGRKKKLTLRSASTFAELDAVATGLRINDMYILVRDAQHLTNVKTKLDKIEDSLPTY